MLYYTISRHYFAAIKGGHKSAALFWPNPPKQPVVELVDPDDDSLRMRIHIDPDVHGLPLCDLSQAEATQLGFSSPQMAIAHFLESAPGTDSGESVFFARIGALP